MVGLVSAGIVCCVGVRLVLRTVSSGPAGTVCPGMVG